MDGSQRQLIRNYLATIPYRDRKAIAGATPGFGGFRAGHGVRTPCEILNHMRVRMLFVQSHLRPNEGENPPLQTWPEEVTAFSNMLSELDEDPATGVPFTGQPIESLLQGPSSDVMTHVGQLAMLRRFAGSPIPAESFYLADIEPGHVTIDATGS